MQCKGFCLHLPQFRRNQPIIEYYTCFEDSVLKKAHRFLTSWVLRSALIFQNVPRLTDMLCTIMSLMNCWIKITAAFYIHTSRILIYESLWIGIRLRFLKTSKNRQIKHGAEIVPSSSPNFQVIHSSLCVYECIS